MNIKINTNFSFIVSSIRYSSEGELCITLSDGGNCPEGQRYEYTAALGDCTATEKPRTSLHMEASASLRMHSSPLPS